MTTDIVIASAARTPVGSFNGAFANTPAHDLGAVAIKAALARAKVAAEEVDEVILGQVLGAGQGQNPARQAAMKAGVPRDKTAFGINQVCGSGLRAVALAMLHVGSGDADIILAGGQESMSLSPHVAHMRAGTKMGELKLVDSMIKMAFGTPFMATIWEPPPRMLRRSGRSVARSRTSSRLLRRIRQSQRRKRAASRMRSRR